MGDPLGAGRLAALLSGMMLFGCHQGSPRPYAPESVEVVAGNTSIAAGTKTAAFALARFRDAAIHDVTADVVWSTSDAGIAAPMSTGAGCEIAGHGIGTATITATYGGGLRGSVAITVTPAVLSALEVTPTDPTNALGTVRQFTATGIFSDRTVQDVTTQVLWQSSIPTTATVDNAPGVPGLASAVGIGSTMVSATHSSSGVTGATSLSVSGAVLVGVAVSPTDPSIALGTTQQFTATGTYSDSSTQDLTTAVTWNSSSPGVAAISNAGGSQGLATSAVTGGTTITATHPATALVGGTALTVTPAVLVGVAVSPTDPSIALGTTQQFTATGTFSDSSTQDLTTAVTWNSSSPGVAAISNAGGSQGLATGAATGGTTITATHPATALVGGTTLTVTAATLLAIAVTPTNPEVMTGSTRQLTATGTYTDSSTLDITSLVTWASSVTATATVSNAGGSRGLVTGVAIGTTTVTATDPGTSVSGSTTVTALADITQRGATANGADSGITTLTIATPGGTEVDDVLIAGIAVRPSSATVTPPAGWTLVRRVDNTSGNANSLVVYRRVAAGNEPVSHSWTLSTSTGSAGGIAAWVGVDVASPIAVEDGATTASGLTHTAPSVTIPSPDAMLVTLHAFSSSSLWTPAPGMSATFQASSLVPENGAGIALLGAHELRASSGATGTRAATASANADTGNAAALALRRRP